MLWVSSQHAALIHTIRTLLKRNSNARCVVVGGFHTGRPAVTRFFRAITADSAERLVLDSSAPFGGLFERSYQGETREWTGGSISSVDAEEEEMGDVDERSRWAAVACLRWALR